MLPAVDAFSGIGGMTYALRGAVRTVAYCENDPECQAVLQNNMRRGLLPKAPIIPDVRHLARHPWPEAVQVLLAGFPCQDISSAVQRTPVGARLGKQSRLVHHLFAMIDRHSSVRAVFLENAPTMVNHGHDYVVRNLARRGFSVRWGLFSAEEVGALHVRKRWFCLAVRGHIALRAVEVSKMPPLRAPRMLPYERRSRIEMHARGRMLGNSVVPQCAAYAWNCLIRAPPDPVHPAHTPVQVRRGPPAFTSRSLGIERRLWGTVTRTSWMQHRDMRERRRGNQLVNQLYYDDKTQAFLKRRYGWRGPARLTSLHFSINSVWVEALMGYPAGWTHLTN